MPASPEGIRKALDPHPMPELPLFSEQHKKRVGMARAAESSAYLLERFRLIAYHLSFEKETLTIDDVIAEADRIGLKYDSKNWRGSVFKGDSWECTGAAPATHEGSHGRLIRTWKRK